MNAGVRWADVMRTSCGISSFSRMRMPACMAGRSESEPIITPTRGAILGDVVDLELPTISS